MNGFTSADLAFVKSFDSGRTLNQLQFLLAVKGLYFAFQLAGQRTNGDVRCFIGFQKPGGDQFLWSYSL
tara:strand:+ start:150479 stop:150685 length:207 start_codon:yes stop_codon:yes gene_type:complete